MYYYHQKLSDSNKRIYINLYGGNSLFGNNLRSSFSQSQKSSKALITIYLNRTRLDPLTFTCCDFELNAVAMYN